MYIYTLYKLKKKKSNLIPSTFQTSTYIIPSTFQKKYIYYFLYISKRTSRTPKKISISNQPPSHSSSDYTTDKEAT